MQKVYDPASVLMPTKFLLILVQVLLLFLVLQLRANHIYWGIGFNYGDSSAQYKQAE